MSDCVKWRFFIANQNIQLMRFGTVKTLNILMW
ncbi:MAG: hypothetical protein K0R57_3889 [Paenibacillaceae bacterium]|jgi:hypothetical protein|nr:hypothetical protein [Paenibacillaceae bacterium]